MIIEDEPLTALHLELVLGDHGASSFSFAATEEEAVASALSERPGLITSDVKLGAGHGPRAVARILEALGPVPVIFITATPGECQPCEPPAMILPKPVSPQDVAHAFRRLAPLG